MSNKGREYSKVGRCIWCLKTKPEVQFRTKPHTIPKKLNAHNIGFDICDSCNSYFGSDNKEDIVTYSIDKVLKEFFNVHKFLLANNKDSNSWKNFKSQFFNYYHSSKTLKFKVDDRRNYTYSKALTRKFKRGVYNIFLQEYHRNTGDGLNANFDRVRNFVRFDEGDVPLYYLRNSKGIRMTEDLELPHALVFNDLVMGIIENYGYFHLMLTGLNFYLAVSEKADENIEYLKNDSNSQIASAFVFDSLIELDKLNQIDFTLQNWS